MLKGIQINIAILRQAYDNNMILIGFCWCTDVCGITLPLNGTHCLQCYVCERPQAFMVCVVSNPVTLLFKTFTSRGDKNTINVSAPIQAPSSGERESRDENDNYNRVMECLKTNDDIVDVENVMSSNICIPVAICQTLCSLYRPGAVYARIKDIA